MKICTQCHQSFSPAPAEIEFLKRINLPLPTLCPTCRRQGRFAWRNDRTLYHRTCSLTGRQIISIYSPHSPYKVYDQNEWHTDKWDAMEYGRDFDFNRPFFEQFNELMLDTPKTSMFSSRNENSDYTNGAQQDKNCYMIFVSDHNQDCYYSYAIDSCTDCTECLNCYRSTLCMECVDCSSSYNLVYCEKTHNSRDSYLLYDCKNCENCFACFGLRAKKYCILNQQYSQVDYEQKIKKFDLGSHQFMQLMREDVKRRRQAQQIHQYYDGNNNDHVTGDHIVNCKNCIECYDSGTLEDCGYLIFSFNSKDCFDGHVVVDHCELCYGTLGTINQYNTQFTFMSFYSKNSMYLDHSQYCQDCFGCSALKRAQYCILNKQYSKEAYEKMRDRIIAHMKKTGEWGMPLPPALSPFGYNETVAQEYFPLDQKEALKNGWKWNEEEKQSRAVYQGPQLSMPDHIRQTPKEITEKVFQCETCKKPYKIIPQEIRLYQAHGLPLYHQCFDDRHLARIRQRNPRQLWKRHCQKCKKPVETTYAPTRPEIIYCEECYLNSVY
ncbi:MAG: hypothetical protein WC882_03140 [Candidatus Gracilibacteria bacterium]